VRTALQEIIANNLAKGGAIPKPISKKTDKETKSVLVDLKDSVVYRDIYAITEYRNFLRALLADVIPDTETANEVFDIAEEYAERYQSFVKRVTD
jgi:hypothetical protein